MFQTDLVKCKMSPVTGASGQKRTTFINCERGLEREKSSTEAKHPPLHNNSEDGDRKRLRMMNKQTSGSPESFNSHSIFLFLFSPFAVNETSG